MKEQVKRAVDSIDVPRGQVRSHLLAGVQQARRPRFVGRKTATGLVAAALLLTVGGGMLLEETPPAAEIVRTDGAVVVPNWAQDEQVEGSSTAGSMLPGLVYQNELYLAMETPLTDDVRALQGKKLGRVTATLEETGDTTPETLESGSNLGPVTLYRVDGYKPSVRLFAVGEEEGIKKVWLLERQTGFVLKTGNDFFRDLNLDAPVRRLAYQTFDQWNDDETAQPMTADSRYRAFIDALYEARAMTREEVPPEVTDYKTMKVLRVTQADGITVSLRLIAGGYVVYHQLGVFFKVDPVVFKAMWEAL
ncbi:hypothetical protein A0126_17885 (plasmid) [Exiguobacterium sp. N4-1P]|uniref:hypothetical protein n=1 Tax=unclassified Exiguobacterium TaxID=2644629 RepID=UPI000B592DA8|nr:MULTISPECIES: hypothetical protein [unclassified Exiguobacterium]ASI35429.1 hypothetical protein A0126_07605 [Exiguobacterium sp. N4-1P]ASI37442.1 hypothetical protein A0126_17885 [Exiguobacterium sp. N4-1P]